MSQTQHEAHDFTFDQSVADFNISKQDYIANHHDPRYSYIGTGALVLDRSTGPEPRVLLLQRAEGDSMPGLWEVPGGACDDEDPTILRGAARELREETGLQATHIGPMVGEPHFFTSSSGKKVCKFHFLVEVEKGAEVKLDTKEHQHFVWASERDVRAHRAGEHTLIFTSPDMEDLVLASFAQASR